LHTGRCIALDVFFAAATSLWGDDKTLTPCRQRRA
jgi:hypothetical protein